MEIPTPGNGPVCAPDPRSLRSELVALVVALLEAREPTYYVLGGSTSPATGLDCSGLIVWACRQLGVDLAAGGIRSTDHMWRRLEAVQAPEPGDLALYGRGREPDPCEHVCLILGPGAGGEFAVAGMSGGGRWCTSLEAAKHRTPPANLRRFACHTYRSDFVGFRRLPFGPLGVGG